MNKARRDEAKLRRAERKARRAAERAAEKEVYLSANDPRQVSMNLAYIEAVLRGEIVPEWRKVARKGSDDGW